jgi:hypothetical protein
VFKTEDETEIIEDCLILLKTKKSNWILTSHFKVIHDAKEASSDSPAFGSTLLKLQIIKPVVVVFNKKIAAPFS